MPFYYFVAACCVVVLGLVFGSFLNVCIYRIPKSETIVYGRSHCMSCGHELSPLDLIPVFSFIFLGGKCGYCGSKISLRYPLVELLNASLWFFSYLRFGLHLQTIAVFAFVSGLIVLSFIDIDTKTLPNGVIIYLAVVAILNGIADVKAPFYSIIIGAAAFGVPLLLIAIITRGGMGGGDVKFAFAAGLFLGWKLSLFALFSAFITGALFGVIFMIVKKRSGKTQIPFAPFLAVGILAALFWGDSLINLYLSLFFT